MPTNGARRGSPHDRLDRAGEYVKRLEQRIEALEALTDGLRQDLANAERQIDGFNELVKQTRSSMHKVFRNDLNDLDRTVTNLSKRIASLETEMMNKADKRRSNGKKQEAQKQ